MALLHSGVHFFLKALTHFFKSFTVARPNVRTKPTAAVTTVPKGMRVSGPTYARSGSFMNDRCDPVVCSREKLTHRRRAASMTAC